MGAKESADKLQELRQEADEVIEKLPAETALGNRDPEGGGEGDPKTYQPPRND